jgi:hypothetical protein
MKKFLVTAMMFLVFAIGLPMASEAYACPAHRRHVARSYRSRSASPSYRTASYVAKRPSFYRRHRNMINMGIGAGAGALVGGLLGGRRGAGLGLLGGAGAGALYTYKLNPKKRRYY